MIGLDLFILAIASITAITLVGFAAKAYEVVRGDWNIYKKWYFGHTDATQQP